MRPGEHEGRQGVFLADPLGVARTAHFLPLASWRVARALDGRATCAAIAAKLNLEADTRLAEGDVAAVVEGLSQRCLLEDALFERALLKDLQFFRDAGRRPAIGAGRDYDADALELRIQLAGLVADDWDMPPLPHAAGMLSPSARIADARLLYARSYASIRHARPDRILLLASAGAPLPQLGVPLDMDLDTPFGVVAVDREGLAALGHFSGAAVLAHRETLSLERQALFLRLIFRGVAVVPLLLGDLDRRVAAQAAELDVVLRGLERVLALPGRTLVVCAADLGSLAGDAALSAAALRAEDATCIDHATNLDCEAFWSAGTARGHDLDRRARLVAPYVLLRLFATREAHPRAPAEVELEERTERDPSDGDAQSGDARPRSIRGSTLGYHQFGSQRALSTAASVVFH